MRRRSRPPCSTDPPRPAGRPYPVRAAMSASQRILQGTVQAFDAGRGLGEIQTEAGEVFSVHRNDLRDDALSGIFPGDIVEFRPGRTRFGHKAALDVRRVGWEEDGGDSPGEWTF